MTCHCQKLREVLTEYRDEFSDCSCDEPEKGHESILCNAVFAFDDALSSPCPASEDAEELRLLRKLEDALMGAAWLLPNGYPKKGVDDAWDALRAFRAKENV